MLMSNKQKKYLKKIKFEKVMVLITQISIVISFLALWEFLSIKEIINPFIFSKPSTIIKTIGNLYTNFDLINHIINLAIINSYVLRIITNKFITII